MRRVTIPRLIVEVFDGWGFRGRRATILAPVRATSELGFENNISSIRIYKGPAYNFATNYRVVFYEDENFQGRKLALGPGLYPTIHDVAYNFGDTISSVKFGISRDITGPEWGTIPVIIELYQQPYCKGQFMTVLRDVANCEEMGMDKATSSIRIYKGPDFPSEGCRVIFFAQPEFEGASLPIEITRKDSRRDILNLHPLPRNFDNAISSIKVEGWSSSTEFSEIVFQDEFDQGQLRPEWFWEDPFGGGRWQAQLGYIELAAEPGQTLEPGQNFDAPRLVQEVAGDFSLETRIRVSPNLQEHAGLLVWKNEHRFLRFEKTSGEHAYKGDVQFRSQFWRRRTLVGRASAFKNVKELYLRLERRGQIFATFASSDAVNWLSCGTVVMGVGDPVHVGIHNMCPNKEGKPTVAKFDYFRVSRRKKEIAKYRKIVPQPLDIVSETDRRRALREVTR